MLPENHEFKFSLWITDENDCFIASVTGNTDLCFHNPCQKKKKNVSVPLVASITSILLVLGVLAILWNLKRRQKLGTFAAEIF